MKKQINPTIKAHLIRGAFYLLLLLAVCAIPFALAQRNDNARQSAGQPKRACSQRCCFGLGTEVCPQFVSWEVYQRRSFGLGIEGECPSEGRPSRAITSGRRRLICGSARNAVAPNPQKPTAPHGQRPLV